MATSDWRLQEKRNQNNNPPVTPPVSEPETIFVNLFHTDIILGTRGKNFFITIDGIAHYFNLKTLGLIERKQKRLILSYSNTETVLFDFQTTQDSQEALLRLLDLKNGGL